MVGSFLDPLPFWYHTGLSVLFTCMNAQRRFLRRLYPHAEMLEPNDFMVDCLDFRFNIFSHAGDLFMHFSDVHEMIEDIEQAGFTLLDYRSAEELQDGIVFSEKRRRSKRLLFYAAQKR